MPIAGQQTPYGNKIRLVRDDLVAGEYTLDGGDNLDKQDLVNGSVQRAVSPRAGIAIAIELSFMTGMQGEPDCFYVEIVTGNYIPLERTRWLRIGAAREHWRTAHERLPELIALYALGALSVLPYPEVPIS